MAVRYITLSNGVPHLAAEASGSIYDESTTVGATITSGTNVTLPSSGTYTGNELEIYYNGQRLEDVVDYVWVGSPPRTQVYFTFDLNPGDIIRFRKDANT